MSVSAFDLSAMADAIETVLPPPNGLPPEVRRTFLRPDASVRLATEIANAGGRSWMPDAPGDEWFDLLSSNVIEFAKPWPMVTMRDDVLAEYARRCAR